MDNPENRSPATEPTTGRRSRRRFLRAALVGGAAALFGPAIPQAAQALPPPCEPCEAGGFPECTPSNHVCWLEQGRITVGAILRTYVSSPLNARGTVTWTMSETRTETFRVIVENKGELAASGRIGPFSSMSPKFNVGGSVDWKQGSSTKVTNAITTASTQVQSIQTSGSSEPDGYGVPDNAGFLMLGGPVLRILKRRWRGQTSAKLHFEFLNGGTILPRSARELRNDPATRNFIGPETADSILSQYPLLNGVTSGVALGLGGPRYGQPTAISPGQIPFSFTQSMTGTTTNIVERSTSVTTGVKVSVGFPGIGGFEVGKTVTTTHTSVQENANSQVISTQGTLTSDRNHILFVYPDLVWNTLLITDEGPLPQGLSALSGTVTDRAGRPVAGAFVSVPVAGVTYQVVTDAAGRYEVRTLDPVQPGSYQVTCAGQTRSVTVTGVRPTIVDYRDVTPALARVPSN
jgi:Carboxypeptidase regulatory-like domain